MERIRVAVDGPGTAVKRPITGLHCAAGTHTRFLVLGLVPPSPQAANGALGILCLFPVKNGTGCQTSENRPAALDAS
jgi:hypothetical protein